MIDIDLLSLVVLLILLATFCIAMLLAAALLWLLAERRRWPRFLAGIYLLTIVMFSSAVITVVLGWMGAL